MSLEEIELVRELAGGAAGMIAFLAFLYFLYKVRP